MKAENKNRWMVFAIVILAVMNLTTFITVIYHQNQIVSFEDITAADPALSESASIKYSGRYFRDELSLNNEQMNKFSEFNPVFRQQAGAINIKLAEKRQEMLFEMAEDNCDTIRLNTLSDSIGYLHSKLKKKTYLYYLSFKNICDKQQQEKLEQLFGEMFATDLQTGQNGTRGQGGRRFGRTSGN
jgi:hypothetical protein